MLQHGNPYFAIFNPPYAFSLSSVRNEKCANLKDEALIEERRKLAEIWDQLNIDTIPLTSMYARLSAFGLTLDVDTANARLHDTLKTLDDFDYKFAAGVPKPMVQQRVLMTI